MEMKKQDKATVREKEEDAQFKKMIRDARECCVWQDFVLEAKRRQADMTCKSQEVNTKRWQNAFQWKGRRRGRRTMTWKTTSLTTTTRRRILSCHLHLSFFSYLEREMPPGLFTSCSWWRTESFHETSRKSRIFSNQTLGCRTNCS